MKARIVFTALSLLMISDVAAAQENPFAPRSNGGLTRAQIEQIARQEYQAQEAQRQAQSPSPAEGAPDAPVAPGGTETLPTQPGANDAPSANPLTPSPVTPVSGEEGSYGRIANSADPVAQLIVEGGNFVGCARSVPIFKDKWGRRIHFTTKELKNSDVVKLVARC